MKIKSDRTIPAARVLALLLALLLALAVLGISPGVACAEEPAKPDVAPSETSTEVSPLPEPEEPEAEDALMAAAAPAEAAPLLEPAETGNDALAVTTVGGFPCVSGEVLVQFRRSASDADVQAALASVDAEDPEEIVNNLHVVEVPEGETIPGYIETLEEQPNVLFAQPNYVYYQADTNVVPASGLSEDRSPIDLPIDPPNDAYLAYQWYLAKIGAYTAWNTTMGDSGVRVAVLDTGADLDHPDLVGRIVAQTDVVDNDGSAEDDNGHGTHVAGIIAATANNNIGVAGVAPGVSLIIVDVFHIDGAGKHKATTASIAAGIYYALEEGADIINLSLGGYQVDTAERNAIDAAAAAGVMVVAAAGNDNTSATIYPGDLSSVICVTATGPNDERAPYSNYGPAKDIAAPGGNGTYAKNEQPVGWMLSTYPMIDPITGEDTSGFAWVRGTSSAAPVVSGVVALMLSADPSLSVDDVKSKLYNSAADLGAKGKDDYFGNGRVNAASAVRSVRGITASSFTIDRRISCLVGVPIGTSIPALQAALTVPFGTISLYDAQGAVVSEGVAKTGMTAWLIDGGVTKDELTIAVKGDVNGDGSLSIADYTLLRLHLLNKISLSPVAAVAGDANGDSALGIADYTDIRLALLKLKPLS